MSSRLRSNISAWQRINAPDFVQTWIKDGVKIPFKLNSDVSSFEFCNRQFNAKESTFLDSEISRLILLDCIEQCNNKPICVNPIHCVPKRNNNYRLITDLRHLNSQCKVPHYRNEDIRDTAKFVKTGDKFVTADLKDGFFHVPVAREHRDYLGFCYKNVYYRWKVLPFGLCCSPYYFCKIVRPVIAYLRSIGLRVTVYVDDFLLAVEQSCATDHVDQFLNTLAELGFTVNFDKSKLVPANRISYIGYTISSDDRHVTIKAQATRVSKLKRSIRKALQQKIISFRSLAKICGQCVSVAWVVQPGKLFLRHAYRLLGKRDDWASQVCLSEEVIGELEWWLSSVDYWNKRVVCSESIQGQIVTDASHLGWGAVYQGKIASGDWNVRVSYLSSNEREMLAILMALKSFASMIQGKRIQVLTDNVSAMAYVNHKGGPSPALSKLALAIWAEATEIGVSIRCAHIAGVENQESDFWSRKPDKHNWMLHPRLFAYIDRLWGPHTIDRFANCQNTQLPRFNSRYWEPGSEAVDALAQVNWLSENNYVNAPFCLLHKVLEIIQEQRARATIIAPKWLAHPFCSRLIALSIAPPLKLPNSPRVCRAMGVAEPCRNRKWALFAWRVCGDQNWHNRVGQ